MKIILDKCECGVEIEGSRDYEWSYCPNCGEMIE